MEWNYAGVKSLNNVFHTKIANNTHFVSHLDIIQVHSII